VTSIDLGSEVIGTIHCSLREIGTTVSNLADVPSTPVVPMLATPGELPTGAGWGYEFKWDGVRAIAAISKGNVRFYARSGSEITLAYPELSGLAQRVGNGVLDGEIVALDDNGRPSFTALAERMHVRDRVRAAQLAAVLPVTYMIFDVIRLDDVDLRDRPYQQRRSTLETLGLDGANWLTPPMFADGAATRIAAAENQLEGVMAKRLDSVYRPGTRTRDWIKFKIDQTSEFVVGGWRPGARTLGALLIGVPTGDALAYRGRVGGGISAASERALLAALRPLVADASPFAAGMPRSEAKDATWVRPELVIEVKYGEQTPDGRLRFPRFVRIRSDLAFEDVRYE
jgi:bifunctional non-homologous end joining protein LigD